MFLSALVSLILTFSIMLLPTRWSCNYDDLIGVQKFHFGLVPRIAGIPVFFGFAFSSGSKAMFIFAAYSFIGVWLHYFCTEKEDFKVIYEKN